MLIVEDGTIVAGANSYDDTANATAYFADRNVTTSITDGDMIAGTEFLDIIYGFNYAGIMSDVDTQALLFPRTSFTDRNGRAVDEGTIPSDLKLSLYHAAKLNSEGIVLVDNANPDSKLQSFTKAVEGAVNLSKTYFAPTSTKETKFIGQYIQPILTNTSSGRTTRA